MFFLLDSSMCYLLKLLAAISHPVLLLSRNKALKNGTHWHFISLFEKSFSTSSGERKENVGLNLHLYHLRLMTRRSAGNKGRKEFGLFSGSSFSSKFFWALEGHRLNQLSQRLFDQLSQRSIRLIISQSRWRRSVKMSLSLKRSHLTGK